MRQRTTTVTNVIDGIVVLGIAVAVGFWGRGQRMPPGGLQELLEMRVTLRNAAFSFIFVILWMECLEVAGLYRGRLTGLRLPTFRAALACGIMTSVFALYLLVGHSRAHFGMLLLLFFYVAFVYQMMRVVIASPRLRWVGDSERILILGSGRRASKAWRELRLNHPQDKRLLGFVDDRDVNSMPPDIAARYMCHVDQLSAYLLGNVVDELIIAVPTRSCYDLAQRAVTIAEAAGVRVSTLNDTYQLRHNTNLRARAPFIIELVPTDRKLVAAESLKRSLDLLIAGSSLIALLPIFIAIAVAIKVTSQGTVFFVQERYGHRRRLFPMWKFRSMVMNAPELMAFLEDKNEAHGPIFKIRNDPRVTPFGRFLRRTSLDELPQLWNVLVGDMSLVGPRPMSVRDVSQFTGAELMRRFSMRPGITGSWQVSGRSSLGFDQWIKLDFGYLDEWSFYLDLKILVRTIPAVIKRSGAA